MKKKTARQGTSCFRRWSRKAYGIFASLGRCVNIGVLSVGMSIISSATAGAQDRGADTTTVYRSVEMERVSVAGRQTTSSRSITSQTPVFKRSTESVAPLQTIESALRLSPAVDVRERGGKGIQTDISIRGGSFDQTMVSLNGINFTDRDSVEQGIDDIMEKFSHMYDLGVRQFGVFVDDIDTGVALRGSENQAYMMAELQRRLEDQYNGSENPADHVAGTYYVPSFYALGFGSSSQLETNLGAFRNANQGNNVIMMMTGSGVWSPIRNSDLLKIQQYTGKKPVMWWNYPVNDNIDDQMLMNRLDSVYATDLDVTASLGVLSNPMNQAEASKVALYGVADYTWNTANFDVQSNWEESFASYTDDPAMQEALRVFASHAAKNQDHTNINSIFNAYKSDSSNYPAVLEEMQKIVDSCQLILTLKDSDDSKLVNLEEEIRPWVYRLNDMSQIIIDCIQAMYGEESQRFDHLMNAIYLSNGIDTLEKYKVESLEGQGTSQTISNYVTSPGNLYILPFARYIMTQAGGSFFTDASDPFAYTDTNTEGWAMAKSGNTFTVTDGETVTLASGSYVQFDLAQLVALSSVSGLDMEVDYEVYTEGGSNYPRFFFKNSKPQRLILEQGVVTTVDSVSLLMAMVNQGMSIPLAGTIVLMDSFGSPKRAWGVVGAHLVKYVGPQLNSNQASMAVSRIELIHNGCC